MTETLNRSKQILKCSPYVGYTFKDQATTLCSQNGLGIFTPQFDDPLHNISFSKMRRNLHCLENPELFGDVPQGKIGYQKNHTFIVKNPNAKRFQKRISGFRLEDLPLEEREEVLKKRLASYVSEIANEDPEVKQNIEKCNTEAIEPTQSKLEPVRVEQLQTEGELPPLKEELRHKKSQSLSHSMSNPALNNRGLGVQPNLNQSASNVN